MMMILHFDKNSFRVLMNNVHERTGYRVDVLEKDYYVVLICCGSLCQKVK